MCGKSPLGGELTMSLLGPGSTLSEAMLWRRCDFEKRSIDAFNELCAKDLVFVNKLPPITIKDFT